MASPPGGAGSSINTGDAQLHLRQNLSSRRLREDLHNVVRTSLTPLIEQHGSTNTSSSTASTSGSIAAHFSSILDSTWAGGNGSSTPSTGAGNLSHTSTSAGRNEWSGEVSWDAGLGAAGRSTGEPWNNPSGNTGTGWLAPVTMQPGQHVSAAVSSAAASGAAVAPVNPLHAQQQSHIMAGQGQQSPQYQMPSHVLEMEVFHGPTHGHELPRPGQSLPQQPSPNNNNLNNSNNSSNQDQQQDSESGWSQVLNSNPELNGLVNACKRYIPFILIIFIKSVLEHGTGIIVFFGLVLTSFHANSVLKNQIARHARRNLGALLAISVNLVASISFVYWVFYGNNICLSAFFIPPDHVLTVYDLIWIVFVNDFLLKFLSILSKVVVTLLPSKFLPYQKRGKYYFFIEITSQLHRELAPLQPWLMYLLHYKGEVPTTIPNKVLGVFLTAGYMVIKGTALLKAIKLWRVAFQKLMQSTRYGKPPSQEQMKASGGFCPICQDSYQEPTMLNCKHIFCEECVATWFDRDTTCPMCRAKVSEDPSWRDGATSQFVYLS